MSQIRAGLGILVLDEPGRFELIRAVFAETDRSVSLFFESSPAAALETAARGAVSVLFFNAACCGDDPAGFMREVSRRARFPVAQIMIRRDFSEEAALAAISAGADECIAADRDSIVQYPRLAARAHARVRAALPARVDEWSRSVHWQAMLGSLVCGVGHEINNQLTGAIAFAELLLQESTGEAVRRDLEKVLKSAERSRKILENFLALARQQKPAKSMLSINETIDRTLDVLGYELKSKSITVFRDYRELPTVFIDGQGLQRLILHLLINALRRVAGNGRTEARITVATTFRKEERVAVIRIADTGSVFEPGIYPEVSAPFPGRAGFSNLDLSEPLRIVAELGGTVQTEGSGGAGAVIVIELPFPAMTLPGESGSPGT